MESLSKMMSKHFNEIPFFNFFQAAAATDVKFYFYYMYMIGMSWSLINMIPYLIVIIYCWYRTRIPGLICACLR